MDTNINWKSFSPQSWKIGTLKGLFRRAFLVCSEQSGQNKEISFLKHVFTKINGYPSRVVNDTLYKVTKTINNEKELETRMNNVEPNNRDEPKVNKAKSDVFPYMTLPYKGQEGEKMMHKLQGFLKNKLPTEVKPRIIYKGQKIGSHFRIKDAIKKEHLSNLVYCHKTGTDTNDINYIGETNVRYETRTYEHSYTDKQSSIFKHAKTNNYTVSQNDFDIIEKGFNKKIDRKIAEALYIKDLKPTLNEQVKSYQIHLFN